YVFVTDSGFGGSPMGVVRFNLADDTATRFATDFDPIDLNVGHNGLVYALNSARVVRAYDPETMQLVSSVTLPSAFYTGIAVAANGDIYACTSSNYTVYRFNSAGTVLGSTLVSQNGFMQDIDLSAFDTRLAITTNFGYVWKIPTALNSQALFNTNTF